MATTLRYAKGESSLGPFVAAMSDRGLAMVEFGDMDEARRGSLAARFSGAALIEDRAALADALGLIAGLIDRPHADLPLALDLRGPPFDLEVWKALRRIPAGRTASYGEIAAQLGVPRQAREVAEACAANIVAVAVPCHRVVKKDGSVSGYRWGFRRKRELIEREARASRAVARS